LFMCRRGSAAILALLCGAFHALAQPALTLERAVERALRNHPSIASAAATAQAAGTVVAQVRAAAQPLITANLTTVGADHGTAIAAGTLQTSGLASRAATGVGFSQLVTDFGRTSNLVESAKVRAAAQDRNVTAAQKQIILQVYQAYYSVLSSDAVLRVSSARVDMQKLTLRQARALAESSLRSTLDVSFAEVALSEAELAMFQSENSARASRAFLAAAMGDAQVESFALSEPPMPGHPRVDTENMVEEALRNRPELSVAKLNESAARRTAEAERRLRYPAITVTGVAGTIPLHQQNLANSYSAAGVNVSLPFLNGGLFSARRAEAELRARSAEKDEQALALQISRAVRVAQLEADNAWRRIEVTTRLLTQTATALRLANARYEAGLSSIIELTQAQLSQTSAELSAARAKYDYLVRLAELDFATGAIQ
jgi:outer membrane protein